MTTTDDRLDNIEDILAAINERIEELEA